MYILPSPRSSLIFQTHLFGKQNVQETMIIAFTIELFLNKGLNNLIKQIYLLQGIADKYTRTV